jgi:hypothetical protein
MLELAFAMAPPPEGAEQGGGGLLALLPPMIMIFHSDQAATEKTEGNSPDVGYLEGGRQRSDLERDSRHGKKT